MLLRKQPVLKPQDLVVALKIGIAQDDVPSYAKMAQSLHMSASEVHGATQRAALSRLLEPGSLKANRTALCEFINHGLAYAFPAVEGPITRGLPTGGYAPGIREHFADLGDLPLVWPTPDGDARGPSITPLYGSVPSACRVDSQLYLVLAAVDAIRAGSARERELAMNIVVNSLL